ncbi:MAG: radical SAM protein [Epsilonproteobacteria bacterium]|nr:MAG: radical SAM protein [Campylobacterota bacterium]
MKFYRIYIELTNICGLSCSFCPTKRLPAQTMSVEFFDSIVRQAKAYTTEVACHVVGDPLTLSNLHEYLDILEQHKMKTVLTSSGYYLKKHTYQTLFHPTVKQINISLNSYNKNDTSLTFEQYLEPILRLCDEKIRQENEIFINLRLWNLNEQMSEEAYNEKLFAAFSIHFGILLESDTIMREKPKTIRLDRKILLHFDHYFTWPSLDNPYCGDGRCQGLDSHIAILASGKVVPCCLDSDGVIALGDLRLHSLQEILSTDRTLEMIKGFREKRAVEKLCQHCSYKSRFSD